MASQNIVSATTRYRPLVLAFTSVAAAYGTYLLYTAFVAPNPSDVELQAAIASGHVGADDLPGSLRRGNAMRASARQPTDQSHQHIRFVMSDLMSEDALSGWLNCRHENLTMRHTLGNPFPSPERISAILQLPLLSPSADAVRTRCILWDVLATLGHFGPHRCTSAPPRDYYITLVQRGDEASLISRDLAIALDSGDTSAIARLLTDEWQGDRALDPAIITVILGHLSRIRIEGPLYLREAMASQVARPVGSSPTDTGSVPTPGLRLIQPPPDQPQNDGNTSDVEQPASSPGSEIKMLLYRIAEDEAKRHTYIHHGSRCDCCGVLPIKGIRWHCTNCADYDLCANCETQDVHIRTHVFAKVKIPIPDVKIVNQPVFSWYTGDGSLNLGPLNSATTQRLCNSTGFQDVELHAMYDKFSVLVRSRAIDDIDHIHAGIDYDAFKAAMGAESWPNPESGFHMIEALFKFWDQDRDGLILFSEYVDGLSCLHKAHRKEDLMKRAFDMHDTDNDGYIGRRDVVKMLMSKYQVQQWVIADSLAAEDARTDVPSYVDPRSVQPLSALYNENEVPRGESRQPQHKSLDVFGDAHTADSGPFAESIMEDGEGEMDSSFWRAVLGRYDTSQTSHQLHSQLDDTHDTRLAARDHYIGRDTVRLNEENGHVLLAPADARRRRAYRPDQPCLSDHGDGTRFPYATVRVSAEEALERQDAIYQVVEEGLHEVIDILFADAENLADEVRASAEQRRESRSQIDELRQSVTSHHEQNRGTEPLLSEADQFDLPSCLTNHGSCEETSEPAGAIATSPVGSSGRPPGSTIDAAPDVTMEDPLDIPLSSQVDEMGSSNEEANQVQDEIIASLQQAALPVDDSSLSTMEHSIHEQSLDELLASTGYSVITPPNESVGSNDEEDASRHGMMLATGIAADGRPCTSDTTAVQDGHNGLRRLVNTITSPGAPSGEVRGEPSSERMSLSPSPTASSTSEPDRSKEKGSPGIGADQKTGNTADTPAASGENPVKISLPKLMYLDSQERLIMNRAGGDKEKEKGGLIDYQSFRMALEDNCKLRSASGQPISLRKVLIESWSEWAAI